MADDRPWITCHVLDTVAGKPAAGIEVRLTMKNFNDDGDVEFDAITNSDGRVTGWVQNDTANPRSLNDHVEDVKRRRSDPLGFKITFFTEDYYGSGNTFYPFIDIPFWADPDQAHYHVPLLMGPWSYTTYRGS